ncbi:MAG: CapA family protein, partial [Blautia massiliensis (ex Durand et al. 2017)]
DLIIGTHPHVTQTAEWLTGAGGNRTFVAYSLGNFLNAQSLPDMMVGAVLDITFQKTTAPAGGTTVEMLDPKLHGVVTQYEAGYENIRVYPFADYTDELGAAHGNFSLTRAQIEEILRGSIDEAFLTLE